MEPFGLIVLANDPVSFSNLFPDVTNYIGPMGFGLSGSGELLRVFDETGALVDTVHYDDAAPWPTGPDGNGPTLELINPGLDNALAESWKSSGTEHGTPGEYNSPNVGTRYVNTTDKSDAEVWPNPFRETADFYVNTNEEIKDGTLLIYSSSGTLAARYDNLGESRFVISAPGPEPGIWFYRFVSNSGAIAVSGKFIT